MKDTDHSVRHRLRHQGMTRNCWGHRDCTWRDTEFGRGEWTGVGRTPSDPGGREGIRTPGLLVANEEKSKLTRGATIT
jgi:hypothetical protein